MVARIEATRRRRSAEEAGRLGKEIYERKIRGLVYPAEKGRVLAIDVESEDWAIADDEIEAGERLKTRRGAAYDAENVLYWRVGFRAMDKWGGGSLRWAE